MTLTETGHKPESKPKKTVKFVTKLTSGASALFATSAYIKGQLAILFMSGGLAGAGILDFGASMLFFFLWIGAYVVGLDMDEPDYVP